MVEIRKVRVMNFERACRALENSFNIGEINTTKGEIKEKTAKVLMGNKEPCQSHNAIAAGVIVQFELNCSDMFFKQLSLYHFIEISPLTNNQYFCTTNFRQLSQFVRDCISYKNKSEWRQFISKIYDIPYFTEYCKFDTNEWSLDTLFGEKNG